MNNNIFRIPILLGLLLLPLNGARAQEGVNATAGFGFPEMLNLGLRMQFEKTQLGVAVGIDPLTYDENLALSANYYYHYGGSSKLTELPPWYFKAGFAYLNYVNELRRKTSYNLVFGFGRELNITDKFGVALEGGLLLVVHEDEKTKREQPDTFFGVDLDYLDFSGIVLPAAGINLYYKF